LASIEFLLDFFCNTASNPNGEEDYSVDLVAILAPPLAEGVILGLSVHCFDNFIVHCVYLSLIFVIILYHTLSVLSIGFRKVF
jgi:hypothetical protein